MKLMQLVLRGIIFNIFKKEIILVLWKSNNDNDYRYDAHSGGEREIQRTMLELLNQLDGFDSRGDVKVILATNRIESLDPALLRPGRIDRKIEFPLPDIKTRRRIFQVQFILISKIQNKYIHFCTGSIFHT